MARRSSGSREFLDRVAHPVASRHDECLAAIGDEVSHAGNVDGDDRDAGGQRFEESPLALVGARRGKQEDVPRAVEVRKPLLLVPHPVVARGGARAFAAVSVSSRLQLAMTDVNQLDVGQRRAGEDRVAVPPAGGHLSDGAHQHGALRQVE